MSMPFAEIRSIAMDIKLMIFDFDGTLYDRNNSITEMIDIKTAQFLTMYLDEEIVQLEARMPNILQVLNIFKLDKNLYENFVFGKLDYSHYFKKDIRLQKLLSKIKCKKIVVSLSPIEYLKNAITEMNIDGFIDDIVSLYSMGEIYKKEEVVLRYLEQFGLNSEEVLCIGDSWNNDLLGVYKMGIEVMKIGKDASLIKSNIKCFANIYDCIEYCNRAL